MSARIIDGQKIAESIKAALAPKVENIKKKIGRPPGLAVVLVGNDPASQTYVSMKAKTCKNLGIFSEVHKLPPGASEVEIVSLVRKLNNDKRIDGILVQLPLPAHINEHKIINEIHPDKDVDGFHPLNAGKWVTGEKGFIPCTPRGIIKLIEHTNINIEGSRAVVIGRSNIVGKPTAALLLNKNATVTICHSKTRELAKITRCADIVVVAVGIPRFLKEDMVKPGAVVIDVGINRVDGRLLGDVDFEPLKRIAGWITPVPGGVGPMTIAMLMMNTIEAVKY